MSELPNLAKNPFTSLHIIMTEENFDNFDLWREVAAAVRELIISHEEYYEWFNDMCAVMSAENPEIPQGTFEFLEGLASGDPDLARNIRGIVMASDCPENEATFYALIFTTEEAEAPEQSVPDDQGEVKIEVSDDEEVNETLTEDLLEQQQEKDIVKLSEFLSISKDTAMLVLKYFGWNTESAMQGFAENRSEVLRKLCIPEDMVQENLGLRQVNKKFECGICYLESDEGLEPPCKHLYCTDCWRQYVETQMSAASERITCMFEGCPCELMLRDVEYLCGKEVANNYHKFITRGQVMQSNQLVTCPGKGCDRVLTLDSVGLCGVAECVCGARICWKCQGDAHAPCTCAQVKRWAEVRTEMWKLQRDQAVWQKREEMLMDYRRSHLHELEMANKQEIDEMKKKLAVFQAEQEKKINALVSQMGEKNAEELEATERQIESMRRKLRMDLQDRNREIEQVAREFSELVQALRSNTYSAFHMRVKRESEEMRIWSQQQHSSEEWIEFATRQCPKCKTRIQKDGGCNYMRCSRCQFEFCWVCGADWATHSDHFVCNKYDEKAIDVPLDMNIDEKEIDLTDKSYHPPPMDMEMKHKFARFNHYNRRFMTHKDAQKAELKKRGGTYDMMMENFRLSTTQEKAREFIERGYRALDRARSVLIWSYPCAYFMEQGSQELNHFEIRQGNLEIVTEKIAGITERYNWESLDVFEHFVGQLEKHTEILLRRIDTFSA